MLHSWRDGPRALGTTCLVCRAWAQAPLCADCHARFAAPKPRCARCGLPTAVPLPACGDCLYQPPPHAATVVLGDYGFPWDRLLADFKYHGQADLAAPLADLLAGAVQAADAGPVDMLLPVPLTDARLRERGFNQAWELARRLPGRLGTGARARADLLMRLHDGAHQAELNRAQRLANLRHAIMVEPRHAASLAGQRIALVDDVVTTGATAAAATRALLDGGAAQVQVWVLARTPPPGD